MPNNKSSNKPFSTLNLNQKISTRSERPATGSQAASLSPPAPLILKSDFTPEPAELVVRTNMINTRNHGLVMGTMNSFHQQTVYYTVWDDEARNLWNYTKAAEKFKIRTRDVDFGDPSRRKKIYKIYVTFRCNKLVSGVRVKYAINGDTTFANPFSDTTYYSNAKGFDAYNGGNMSEEWITAELKPSAAASANNVYSFALQFDFADAGRINVLGGENDPGSNSITLDSSASSTDDYFNGMPIYFFKGPGSGNSHRIIDYNGTTKVATITPALNKYVSVLTHYDVGFIPASFQINDISIVYREKGIK